MRRRQLLRSAAAAAALAFAPGFVRRAFGDGSCPLPANGKGSADNASLLAEALARAQRNGRTLLVLVIPEDDGKKYDRGSAFGAWLNHGTPKQLAPLSACEVVCARMTEVRQLVTGGTIAGALTGEPLMVAFWPEPKTVIPLGAELPEVRGGKLGGRGDWQAMTKREDQLVDQRIALLANLLRNLRKDADHFDADAVALAAEVKARLVAQRVPGSRWGRASGCGTTVEGDEGGLQPACGMGHVPNKASRFLYMYAQTPGEQQREYLKQVKKSL